MDRGTLNHVTFIVSDLTANSQGAVWQELKSRVETLGSSKECIRSMGMLYTVLHKVNMLYGDVRALSHANETISACCVTLSQQHAWRRLPHKHQLNTAKVLSHLSVKVANKGFHETCMHCCQLLLSISWELEDVEEKDQRALTGHVYKSLWNKHAVSTTSSAGEDIVFFERSMAVQMSVASGWHQLATKLMHQLNVAVSTCASKHAISEGLKELEVSVARAVDKFGGEYKHLSLFVTCLQAVHSPDHSTIQVSSSDAECGPLCQQLLERYKRVGSGETVQPISEEMLAVTTRVSSTVGLYSLSILSAATCKLITSIPYMFTEVQTLLSWCDLLLADTYLCRKFYKLEVKERRKPHLSREVFNLARLAHISSDVVCRWDFDTEQVSSLLAHLNDLLKSLADRAAECDSNRLVSVAESVGQIIYGFVKKPGSFHGMLVTEMNTLVDNMVSLLAAAACFGSMVQLLRQACDMFSHHGNYLIALNLFKAMHCLPSKYWDLLVAEWCKVKKRSVVAATTNVMLPSVAARVLAVEVFHSLANKDDIMGLLLKEFAEFTIKEPYREILEAVVNAMKAKAVSKLHTAHYYLCKTELLVSLDVDTNVAEVCIRKGFKLLDGNLSSYANDIKAQLHTWMYIVNYNHSTSMSKVTEALSVSNYQAMSVGVRAQLVTLQPLDLAIDLWKESVGSANSICCVKKTAQCLDMIANTFYSARNLNKMLTVCKLAADLLSPPNMPQSMLTLQVEAALLLGDVQAAREMFKLVEDSGSNEAALLRASMALHSGEVQLAVSLLEELIQKQKKSTLEEVRTLASAHHMLLHLVMNNSSISTEANSAHHAWHCQREHASLFNSLSHFPVRTYGMKLKYLDDMLSSYITLGKWNLLVGNVRESACFLQAALNMARLLILPSREAEVLIIQAKLSCFLADFNDAEASLQRAHSTLSSERRFARNLCVDVGEATAKDSSHGTKTEKQDLSRVAVIKRSNLFGFESEEDQDDSFSMKQPHAELSDDEDAEYNVPSYDATGLRDVTASPSLKNPLEFKTADWASNQHPASCQCHACNNCIQQMLYLDMLHALCTYRLQSGAVDGAIKLARECLDRCQTVEDRFTQQGHRSSVHLITCCLNFHYTIMKGSLMLNAVDDVEKEWQAARTLKTNAYHKLIICQLTYMSYLPQLAHRHQSMGEASGNKPASATTDYPNMSSPFQPINSNSAAPRPSVINAPRKTRTAIGSKLSQLAFDDSDEENSAVTAKRSERRLTSRNKTKRVGSTSVVTTPLSSGLSRIRSAKNAPITVFCDDEMEEEQSLEPKRSTRTRRKVDRGMSAERRSSRKSARGGKETMRSFSTGDVDDLDSQLVGEIFSPVKEVAGDDDSMELLRGDEETTTSRRRKCSAAEAMRSAAAPGPNSPPEFISLVTPEQSTLSTRDSKELIPALIELWESIRSHPPFELYRCVCQSLAVLYYRQSNHWLAAFYLMETQAITLSHKTNLVAAQKYHQRSKESDSMDHKPIIELSTEKSMKKFKKAINSIPAGFVAISLSVVAMPNGCEQQLYLTRLERNQEPVVVLANKMARPQNIWKEFEGILQDSKMSMRETKKDVWWEKRRSIDERLKSLLVNLQKQLGVARAFLLGTYTDSKARQVVEKVTDGIVKELSSLSLVPHRSMIRMLVNGAEHVNEGEVTQLLTCQYPAMSALHSDKLAYKIMEGVRVTIDSRQPAILCLDKDAHSLCWESMPYISESSFTRMSSVYTIQSSVQALAASSAVYAAGIDSDLTFYVLNPDDNLPSTESLFRPILTSKKKWRGIVATKPTSEQYKRALTDNNLFIFLGHGNGSKFLKARELCKINCEAAVLLMGCSSGALDSRGSMESAGIVNDYQIANCPSVTACLWDVTDKDIDRFTNSLINKWLMADGEKNPRLLDHIPAARRACKLEYLVGSATVVYGLPVSLKTKK